MRWSTMPVSMKLPYPYLNNNNVNVKSSWVRLLFC